MYEIHVRDVPEHLVVQERATLAQADLFDYLVAAMARVHTSAQALGGAADTTKWPYLERDELPAEPLFFVTYHGNPNDGPIPVEVATPVLGEFSSGVERQPAFREAFVRLTKAQTESVGSAYDAVESWAGANGLTIAGPPREVFYTDFMAAGPDTAVFDVAFPVTDQ